MSLRVSLQQLKLNNVFQQGSAFSLMDIIFLMNSEVILFFFSYKNSSNASKVMSVIKSLCWIFV